MLCCKPNNRCHFHSRVVGCDLLVIRSHIFFYSFQHINNKNVADEYREYLLLAKNTWFTALYWKFPQSLHATVVYRHVGI